MNQKFSLISIIAVLFALCVGALYFYVVWQIRESNPGGFYLLLLLGIGGGILAVRYFTGKSRRRRRILQQPFPEKWRDTLEKEVNYYQELASDDKKRFEQEVQLFLGEKRVSGINTEIDDRIRVLVAASAVIPIFGFPDWDYPNLEEVLIYPGSFDDDFRQSGKGRDILGMVGEGAMNRVMILSKPALISGFRRHHDAQHTALHEFVHLIDAADGAYDGVPALLDRRYVEPWLDLIHREMQDIRKGRSDLDDYGAVDKREFFAVASEYFFEKPEQLKNEHPKLYRMLEQIFQQDTLKLLSRKSTGSK